MRFDVVAAIEACYAPALDDRAWLGGILAALAPLDRGAGRCAQILRRFPGCDPVPELTVEAPAVSPGALARQPRSFSELPLPTDLPASHRAIRWLTRQAAGAGCAEVVRFLPAREGLDDALGMSVEEPGGRTILVCLKIAPGGHPPPRTVNQLTHVAGHLGAAARLRHALRAAVETGATEATLEARARTSDVPGRRAAPASVVPPLADRVRGLVRTPGALRSSEPNEAVEVWRGLVSGAWSLVDQVERGGARSILARRNPPGVRDPKALTGHERGVVAFAALGYQNKLIGYALGLSPSAVAAHLRAAERKLKLSSRADLVRLLAPLVVPPRSRGP